jgi:hypothetical protein
MSTRPKKPRKRARKAKPKKPGDILKPVKITGCVLWGARYNEHGEQIGEEPMTNPQEPFVIWAPNFPKLKQTIDRELKVAEAAEAAREADGDG